MTIAWLDWESKRTKQQKKNKRKKIKLNKPNRAVRPTIGKWICSFMNWAEFNMCSSACNWLLQRELSGLLLSQLCTRHMFRRKHNHGTQIYVYEVFFATIFFTSSQIWMIWRMHVCMWRKQILSAIEFERTTA